MRNLTAIVVSLTTVSVASAAPGNVTVGGSFQTEAGCAGDWDPACVSTDLTYDPVDDVWQGTFTFSGSGDYEYKIAIDHAWTTNYGLHATSNGPNIPLTVAESAKTVKFFYDDKTHWVVAQPPAVIAVVAGTFQSEVGCSADWQPDCLRGWLQDPSGGGTLATTLNLPAGSYETKVAINESWVENYGAAGALDGENIGFTVAATGDVTFSFDPVSHVLMISGATIDDLAGPNPEDLSAVPIDMAAAPSDAAASQDAGATDGPRSDMRGSRDMASAMEETKGGCSLVGGAGSMNSFLISALGLLLARRRLLRKKP